MQTVVGRVEQVLRQNEGMQVLKVQGRSLPAACFPQLTGACRPGDHVELNITATQMNLGTGGYDFVMAVHRDDAVEGGGMPWGQEVQRPLAPAFHGHVMKLRYTPLQRDVNCIEDPVSPFYDTMLHATSLDGMPVVCCGLHSQVVPVAAGIRHANPDATIVYCMTDEAALMLPFSDAMRQAIDSGLINLTISCGQAMGGNLEATTLHSALLATCHVLHASVAIVSLGPGIVGTATPLGNGGVAQAAAVNAVAALGGRACAVARISFADPRDRHRGVSHHFLTAMGTLALARAAVCLPSGIPDPQMQHVRRQLQQAGVTQRHDVVEVPADGQPFDTRGIALRSMGRSFDDDPWFFTAAWCAGVHAAGMLQA